MSEDEVGARHHLHVFDDGRVALVRIDLLVAPLRERMRAARGEPQIVVARQRDDLAADGANLLFRLLDVPAYAGADLDHGLVHLRLHALGQKRFTFLDNLRVDVGPQVARLRVDGLVFFLDTDIEAGPRAAEGCTVHDVPPVAGCPARNFDQL